jgi:acetyl esterase
MHKATLRRTPSHAGAPTSGQDHAMSVHPDAPAALPFDPRHDPALDAHVEGSRNVNQLAAAFAATLDLDEWMTPEGIVRLRAGEAMPGQAPLADTELIEIPGPAGAIPARVRRPRGEVRGAYLDLHGGGWCIGSAANTDLENAHRAEDLGVATVAIDYRLAPEHPFPAGPDDCEAAALWFVQEGPSSLGTGSFLIGGASAGAHLAALTVLRLRDRHGLAGAFRGVNLVFGAYDLGMTPSQRTSPDAVGIPTPVIDALYAHALPGLDAEARRDPSISPLYADLHDLPPTLLTVGTLDPLLDDSLFLAARLRAAGNDTALAVYPESIHAFTAFPTELARIANARIDQFLLTCLS